MIVKKSILLVTALFSFSNLSASSIKEDDLDGSEKSTFTPKYQSISRHKQKEESYTSDLSESYRTKGIPTEDDFTKMEAKFKEDFLRKGYKGQFWTQEHIDIWEISEESREEMNSKADKPFQLASKKAYFQKLNQIVKSLDLKRPKPTDLSDLSETYRTTGVPTQEDFTKMGIKFEEDYEGDFWTQEKVDEWEISQAARDRANSYSNYRRTLRKTVVEFYDYWEKLNK